MSPCLHARARRSGALLVLPLIVLVVTAQFGCGDDNPAAPPSTPKPQKVLKLDGAGDYMTVPLASHSFNRFTFEAWVKVSDYDANVHYISLYQTAHIVLGDYGSGNGPVSTWATSLSPVNAGDATVESDITPATWHHLALSYDGTNQYVLVDGDVVLTVPTTGTVLYDTGTYNQGLVIGARYTGGTQYVTGEIDEVRLWNVYRTPEQIRANMDVVLPDKSGLVGYWNFDDGTTKDRTAYAANGTLVGDAVIVDK